MAKAEELVRYFHQIVHGVDQHLPQSKELGQAVSLITQYGFEQSRFVVEYAAGKAGETGFAMQHFGAVLSYASRAVADFAARQKRANPNRERSQNGSGSVAGLTKQTDPLLRGRARLDILSPQQFAERYDKTKVELFARVPFLAQRSRRQDLVSKSTLGDSLLRFDLPA